MKLTRRPHIMAVLFIMATVACAHPRYDINTNPVGATAYYADQVIQLNGQIEKALMAAESVGRMTTADTRTALGICRQIDEKGAQLAVALRKLGALDFTNMGRQPILQEVNTILTAINALLFNVVLPIGDNQTRAQTSDLLEQIGRLLLTVQGGIR